MVPHLAVEEALQDGLGLTKRVVAAVSVPDGKGQDKLAVLYAGADADTLRRIMAASPLPASWKPDPGSFYGVDRIPVIGGKLDLKAVKRKALELAAR